MFLGEEWTWRKQQRSFSEDCLLAHIHPGRVTVGLCISFCVLSFLHFVSHTPLKSCISTTSHSWLWNIHLTLWEIFGWRYMTYV